MITRMIALLALFMAINQPMNAAPLWDNIKSYFSRKTEELPQIRIMIVKEKPKVHIEVEGKYRMFDPRNNDHLATRPTGRQGDVTSIGSGLHWNEGFPGVHQLMIVPDKHATIKVDGKAYYGSMIVYEVEGLLTVINSINFEDLLTSVLDKEVGEHEPLEFLSASAIVARTNAYSLAENPANPYWSVQAEDLDYYGIPQDKDMSLIEEAVRNTRYMVLSAKGTFEGVPGPLSVDFAKNTGAKLLSRGKAPSKITFTDAKKLSESGKDAADILLYAFPDAQISMIRYSPGKGR